MHVIADDRKEAAISSRRKVRCGVLASSETKARCGVWCQVKGRLHLCSRNLAFDPDQLRYPVVRLPFS